MTSKGGLEAAGDSYQWQLNKPGEIQSEETLFMLTSSPKSLLKLQDLGERRRVTLPKNPPCMKTEAVPLPRKVGGRAVKTRACISLLCYVSQERKPSFLKKQRIYFLSPLSESHSVTVNNNRGGQCRVYLVPSLLATDNQNSHPL